MRNVLTRLLGRGEDSPSAAPSRPASEPNGDSGSRVVSWLGRPMTSFHLVVAVVALLTSLGLIMVLSASGVRSYDDDGSPWIIFGRQVIWTIVGLIAFYLALRVPVRVLR